MFEDLKSYFSSSLTPAAEFAESSGQEEIRRAAAALLLICARADFEHHPEEQRAIINALEQTFMLGEPAISELLHLLDEETNTTRLLEFTRLVNRYYSTPAKIELLENLWRVAFADGRLDEFEEHYIARVAFLIRIDQEQLQACRHAAAP
ncbi:MAG: TerB family tellurite resistance protein [Proteobacteria bacterium]|nr:TerB family tellurite resistance protein [Pseudomonadota bacterium]